MIEKFDYLPKKTKHRGFEKVITDFKKNKELAILPIRSTINSAGYDFILPINMEIVKKSYELVYFDIKSYMESDEFLSLHVRSSLGLRGLMIKNTTGIIDSDYYNNPKNDGNISLTFYNFSNNDIFLEKGSKVIQGIFQKYLIADNCNTNNKRDGGMGSTGK